MCGIVGTLENRVCCAEVLHNATQRMMNPLVHRGPDDSGIWTDAEAGVSIGHQRLSIQDLSSKGAQPMVSGSGRYVLSYNGEIYNTREISSDLKARGVGFRSHSDTEILLEACDTYGLEHIVERLIGMFAFALWDRSERCLWLVRDRLGIKPIYYSATPHRFTYASELTGIKAHPYFNSTINQDAVAAYLAMDYIPAPHSIFSNVRKLEPGTILRVNAADPAHVTVKPYWTLAKVAQYGIENRFPGEIDEATDELEYLIADAIKRRMISDVPLGAFLSGGIDSSLVVALMQKQSKNPVKTFSIGFEQFNYNEAPHAKAIAKHLGTDHTELYISNDEISKFGPTILESHDEPFADPSLFPTWLLAHMARDDVTVALTGDGGDEVFGGYNRHLSAERCFNHSVWGLKPFPKFLFSRFVPLVPKYVRKHLQNFPVMQMTSNQQPTPKEIKIIARGLYNPHLIHYQLSHGDFRIDRNGIIRPVVAINHINYWLDQVSHLSAAERQQYIDISGYLPDNVLCKVDRASMAVSLEARVPLLDHRIVEFAFRLPSAMKTNNLTTKRILRKILARHVPPYLFDRPKKGFDAPVDTWLCGPLKDWCITLMSENPSPHHFIRPKDSAATLSKLLKGRVSRSDFRRIVLTSWLKNNT